MSESRNTTSKNAAIILLVLATAESTSLAALADSNGKFPGRGSEDAYNRAVPLHNEGARKYKEKDYESSIRLSKQAIAIYPFDSATHDNLGNALRRVGKPEESIAEFKRAIELEPKFLQAWLGLGMAYEAMRNLSEAERCYRKALEIKPDSFGALFDIGDLLRQQGKFAEARTWLLRARAGLEGKDHLAEVDKTIGRCDKNDSSP